MIEGVESEGAAERFRAALGAQALDTSESIWRYACNGLAPRCVLLPGNVEALQAAVRFAFENGLAIVPSGGASHLNVGFPPRRYDAALSTCRLDRVVEHDAGDMTLVVEAGARLAAVNGQLAEAGQWLPLDPAPADDVTIGGIVAADRAGPLRLAYGKVRDHLIGITAVCADGNLVRGGGRVVKNVAGYDLPRLFAGSFGTLGVIVQAIFKLRPRPPCRRVFALRAESVAAAVENGLALLETSVTPVFLEALNEAAAEVAGAGSSAALMIGCAGTRAEVDAHAGSLLRLYGRTIQEIAETEADAMHRALRHFPQPLDDDALVARVSTRPAELPRLLRRYEEEARVRGLTLDMSAHAGSGVAWCQLAGPRSLLDFELCAEWMRLHAREHGAWVVYESLPAGLYGKIDPWGFHDPALPLMAGVKKALDPRGVLSPGRFVGRI